VSASTTIEIVRGGWLTLAFMMLLSRVIFQAAGPARMRAFLDGWQSGGVKRIWGGLTLCFAVVLVVLGAGSFEQLSLFGAVLLVALLVMLVADGLVNVLPAGFETFKDRLQRAWVARQRGTGREGDRYLFLIVNAVLALASAAVAAAVLAYRAVELATPVIAAAIALVLTPTLIGASEASARRRGAKTTSCGPQSPHLSRSRNVSP
jgi:hypothetical protein